jgi:hypothetical protein
VLYRLWHSLYDFSSGANPAKTFLQTQILCNIYQHSVLLRWGTVKLTLRNPPSSTPLLQSGGPVRVAYPRLLTTFTALVSVLRLSPLSAIAYPLLLTTFTALFSVLRLSPLSAISYPLLLTTFTALVSVLRLYPLSAIWTSSILCRQWIFILRFLSSKICLL